MEDIQEDLDLYRSEEDERPSRSTDSSIVPTETENPDACSSLTQTSLPDEGGEYEFSEDISESRGLTEASCRQPSRSTTIGPGTSLNETHFSHGGDSSSHILPESINHDFMHNIGRTPSWSFTSPLSASGHTVTGDSWDHQRIIHEGSGPSPLAQSRNSQSTDSTKKNQELLKFFIDKVAPWV